MHANGALYVFGGNGLIQGNGTTVGLLNDLWQFNFTSSNWTFLAGNKILGALGNYGSLGVQAPTNVPRSRMLMSMACSDSFLYIFAGFVNTHCKNICLNVY